MKKNSKVLLITLLLCLSLLGTVFSASAQDSVYQPSSPPSPFSACSDPNDQNCGRSVVYVNNSNTVPVIGQSSPYGGVPVIGQNNPVPVIGQNNPVPVIGQNNPVPVIGQNDPVPVIGQNDPVPVIGQNDPVPVIGQNQPVPVIGQNDPVPVISQNQPVPVIQQPQPVPVIGQNQPVPVIQQPQPVPVISQNTPQVTTSMQAMSNGSMNLTFTVLNTSGQNWTTRNNDILCIVGQNYLTNPGVTRWDLPVNVRTNNSLSFTINIWAPSNYSVMTFSIMNGNASIFTFSVPIQQSYSPVPVIGQNQPQPVPVIGQNQPYSGQTNPYGVPVIGQNQPYSGQYNPYGVPVIGQNQPVPVISNNQPNPVPVIGQNNPQVTTQAQRQSNGTINLTWTVRNTSGKSWPSSNIDILCIGGQNNLTNQGKTRWDIPYSVMQNGSLSYTVNIYPPAPGSSMTFSMMDGGTTVYTFNVPL